MYKINIYSLIKIIIFRLHFPLKAESINPAVFYYCQLWGCKLVKDLPSVPFHPCNSTHCFSFAKHKRVNKWTAEKVWLGWCQNISSKRMSIPLWPVAGSATSVLLTPSQHSSCPVPTAVEWHWRSEWTNTKGDPLLPDHRAGLSLWLIHDFTFNLADPL